MTATYVALLGFSSWTLACGLFYYLYFIMDAYPGERAVNRIANTIHQFRGIRTFWIFR